MIGPYSYHLYGVDLRVFTVAAHLFHDQGTAAAELPRLLKTMWSCCWRRLRFLLSRWQKKIDLFKLLLLVMASVVAFRTMRDSWFLCVAAAACIADIPVERLTRAETGREPRWNWPAYSQSLRSILLLFAPALDFNTRGLDRAISGMFPVNAVNFVHQNRRSRSALQQLRLGRISDMVHARLSGGRRRPHRSIRRRAERTADSKHKTATHLTRTILILTMPDGVAAHAAMASSQRCNWIPASRRSMRIDRDSICPAVKPCPRGDLAQFLRMTP